MRDVEELIDEEEREATKAFVLDCRHLYSQPHGRAVLTQTLIDLGLFEQIDLDADPNKLIAQVSAQNYAKRLLAYYLEIDMDDLYDRFVKSLPLPPVGNAPAQGG